MSVEVEKVATPAETAVVPRTVAPSEKVMFPVADELLRVAVKVTGCPEDDGLSEDARFTVGATLLTFWVSGAEVDALQLVSPL